MKNILKNIALSLGLTFGFAVAANAQSGQITSGSVMLTVDVAKAVDIRTDGAATGNGITPNSQAANVGIATTLAVSDASPNTNNGTLTATVPFRLRSNTNYKVTATRSGTADGAPEDFDSNDIGLQVTSVSRTGNNVVPGNSDTINSTFSGTTGTVAGIATAAPATELISGPRISKGGNNDDQDTGNNNYATSSLVFSIKRQYYTPTGVTSFTQTLAIGIVAP